MTTHFGGRYNPPLERTAAAVYFTCGRASRVRRRGRSTAFRYLSGNAVSYRIEQDDSTKRRSFGEYTYRIYDGDRLIAKYWHDHRGDEHGIEFTDGRTEDWPAEVAEFLESVADAKPASAARWLQEYLPGVRCIYAFQVLNGTKSEEDWSALHAVRTAVQESVGGIMQADGEGFSNEEGCHILWQFHDDVKGPWWMAILQRGEWITFEMELGNRQHREAFLRGEMPPGVTAARPGE